MEYRSACGMILSNMEAAKKSELTALVTAFAEDLGFKGFRMDEGVAAFLVDNVYHVEIQISEPSDSLMLFCDVGLELKDAPGLGREWLARSLDFANRYGIFFVMDPRDDSLVVSTSMPAGGVTTDLLATTIDRLLAASQEARGLAHAGTSARPTVTGNPEAIRLA